MAQLSECVRVCLVCELQTLRYTLCNANSLGVFSVAVCTDCENTGEQNAAPLPFAKLNHSQCCTFSLLLWCCIVSPVCVCCDYRDAERERKTRQIVHDLESMQHEAKMERLTHRRKR